MKLIVMTILCAVALASAVRSETRGCSEGLAKQADSEIAALKTWEEIYESFRNYSACDEGVIAEGYSNAVVRMLADRWMQLSGFQTLASRDSGFREFVFRHIDATVDRDDLTEVITNASDHCPRRYKTLCDRIRRRAASARSEIDSVIQPPTKESK